jgi:thioredoxin reductase (NADPH)
MYDLIIVGGGAAGLTAGIYAKRANLHFVLLEQDGFGGGQIQTTERVDNFPGSYGIGGAELAEQLVDHAQTLGVPFQYALVEEISKIPEGFQVLADGETLEARTVIYAAGASHSPLEVPGAKELEGQGVSYCATCDGAFYEGQEVAVVGSGDTAVTEAISLSKICSRVHLLYRKPQLKAAPALVETLKQLENIRLYPSTQVTNLEKTEQGIRLSLLGAQTVLDCAGVFAAIGIQPETEPLDGLGLTLEDGYIPADETGVTAIPGFFAAGDVRKKQLRQLLTAAADGANAVTSAQRYLSGR